MSQSSSPLACFYFQVHQPYRLRDLRITDIGGDGAYTDDEKNQTVFRKVAEKCYLPANALMLELLQTHPDFHIAYSLSGVFMDQCEEWGQDVLESFKKLAATGRVEFLGETAFHSLSSIGSKNEFATQVQMHTEKIIKHFGVRPEVFRNTELIYSNEIAHMARLLGFRGVIAEGADHILTGREPTTPYVPPRFRLPKETERAMREHRPHTGRARDIKVLLKHYRLSDDIAFRFSSKQWQGYPLTADTFADWVRSAGGHNVNLFMDYETIGEHQWADTGIFEFFRALPKAFTDRGIATATPSQVLDSWGDRETQTIDAHFPVSWADSERDLSAWLGNRMQDAAFAGLYALETAVQESGDETLLRDWRRLQTSDHFYYMCTKHWSDGDVHKYFSPYDSPYEAYRRYSHALCDLKERLASSSHA